jgi:aquaporin Z
VAGAGGIGGALIVEVALTFIFVLTILGVTDDKSKGGVAGIVIGLTLTFVHIVGIPLTGTSVNPARSIGPALFVGGRAIADLWVFIVAPLVGAALAALVYKAIKSKKA